MGFVVLPLHAGAISLLSRSLLHGYRGLDCVERCVGLMLHPRDFRLQFSAVVTPGYAHLREALSRRVQLFMQPVPIIQHAFNPAHHVDPSMSWARNCAPSSSVMKSGWVAFVRAASAPVVKKSVSRKIDHDRRAPHGRASARPQALQDYFGRPQAGSLLRLSQATEDPRNDRRRDRLDQVLVETSPFRF